MCFYHLPDLDSGLGPRETSWYADEGESGSGADGGESVRPRVGRWERERGVGRCLGDGGESGMVCLRKDWWAKLSARTIGWTRGESGVVRASVAFTLAVVAQPPGSIA